MPPTLDLSGATHAKMVVAPPRINLRRAASYNHDRGPLSSTSSRFSFNHLVFAASPPPSPRLPTLVPPPPRRKSHTPRPSRVFKGIIITFALGGLLLLYISAASADRRTSDRIGISLVSSLFNRPKAPEKYQMAPQQRLPDVPVPLIFNDKRGNARWAISIPPEYVSSPPTAKEYEDIGPKCRVTAKHVNAMRHPGKADHQVALGATDRYFMDVQEAQSMGFLPTPDPNAPPAYGKAGNGKVAGGHRGGVVLGEGRPSDFSHIGGPVCSSSLIFVLESADAGLGRTLMDMWTAYGLAGRQGRAFFVDDSRWAYGEYTDIFRAPPAPSCRPPPRNEMLPCPLQARHLVVTSATVGDYIATSLGLDPLGLSGEPTAVKEGLSSAGASPQQLQARQKERFDLARAGFEALFKLNSQDHAYVEERFEKLLGKTQAPMDGDDDGIVVGVHVRRGDRHPVEYQYRDSYIPVNVYTDRAQRILDLTYNSTIAASGHKHHQPEKGAHESSFRDRSLVVVASDDPDVYEAEEFASAARAQEQIKLASKAHLLQADQDRSVMHKFVDDTFGWEGGFFAAMFWSLGMSSTTSQQDAAAARRSRNGPAPPAETLRLRSYMGRAYMMDLAVLARASDVVICGVSAMGCRLLAVMMGWEKAMENGYWVNIDGDFGWDAGSW